MPMRKAGKSAEVGADHVRLTDSAMEGFTGVSFAGGSRWRDFAFLSDETITNQVEEEVLTKGPGENDGLADDAVWSEPLSQANFPAIREK
jgi:hypothetical protein